MININGKVVLITGAGSGIGKAIIEKLSEEKINAVLFGGRNVDNLNKTKEAVEKNGSKCLVVPGDLLSEEFLDNGIKKVIELFGGIDILINDAGLANSRAFEEVSEKEFDDIMALDVKVPFFLCQKTLPYLKKSETPTIINIASVVAHSGYAQQSTYSCAKHALLGFTKSLARETYKDNVRVHVISPGGVFTDMVKKTRPDLTGDNMTLPEEVAETALFLIKSRSNAVIDEIMIHRPGKEPFSV